MATAQHHASVGQGRYYHDKKVFINAQVRLLEAPIQPPSDWRRKRARLTAEGETQTSIPDALVSSALSKLHATTKKSSRLTFNYQSVRQLLEQLEANQYELRKKARQGGIIVRTKSVQELLQSEWIDTFPETWQQSQQEHEDNELASAGVGSLGAVISASSSSRPLAQTASSSRLQKYADLRSRIVALQTKHQSLKDKREYYKTLQTEIRWLDAEEVLKNVLAPDSQVVQELEKMRALLPKVIGILDSRRDVIAANRKHEALLAGPDAPATRPPHLQSSNPLDALMDCFQD